MSDPHQPRARHPRAAALPPRCWRCAVLEDVVAHRRALAADRRLCRPPLSSRSCCSARSLDAPDAPLPLASRSTWFAAGKLQVNFTINVDPLSAIMLVMVTFIATWIAIFSSGYMHGDPGYPRFFAVMSLFVFCMSGLVLANNFLLLVAFWEGVGLCCYLLVGF